MQLLMKIKRKQVNQASLLDGTIQRVEINHAIAVSMGEENLVFFPFVEAWYRKAPHRKLNKTFYTKIL